MPQVMTTLATQTRRGFYRQKRSLTFRCLCTSVLIGISSFVFAQADDLVTKSQRAKEAMNAGRFEEAVVIYQELVKAIPGNPGLRMNLGLALHSAGRYREASRQFETVAKDQPDFATAWLMLGLAHQKLGEPEKAIPPLERALKLEPENKIALMELADGLLSAGRPEEAETRFQQLTELEPGNAKTWQGLGLSYVALSRRAFAELEKIAPETAYWYCLLARSLASRNQLHTAFKLYKTALAKSPTLRGVHASLAEIYQKTGHADWAAAEEERERKLVPPDCAAQPLECDFLAGRFREMLARARQDTSAESYYWQARAYEELSLDAFSHLSEMPPSGAVHDLMAEAYRMEGKYDLAAKEWEEALRLAPQDRRLQNGLARALWLNRDYDKARPLLEELLKVEPESAELNYELGDALLRSESAEQALAYLETAVKLSPDHVAAHASLGRAYMRMGRAEAAIPHLQAALELDEEGSLYYQLAQAYQKVGQKGLAAQSMQKFEEASAAARARRPKSHEEFQITPP